LEVLENLEATTPAHLQNKTQMRMTTDLIITTRADLQTLIIDCMAAALKHHEAAALLSCSRSTIDNAARAGKLRRHYIGKAVRFTRGEVLALAKAK
jgi:excisionase family DNA binding protein